MIEPECLADAGGASARGLRHGADVFRNRYQKCYRSIRPAVVVAAGYYSKRIGKPRKLNFAAAKELVNGSGGA